MPGYFFMVQKAHQYRQILIIDDDPASLFLARMTLEDMQIARKINPVQSAGEGLHYLRTNCLNGQSDQENCPDLILLDINMPGMDGFDFLDCLTALGQQELISRVVVALTSSSAAKDRERMQSYGVQDYLVKPITEEEIRHLVQ